MGKGRSHRVGETEEVKVRCWLERLRREWAIAYLQDMGFEGAVDQKEISRTKKEMRRDWKANGQNCEKSKTTDPCLVVMSSSSPFSMFLFLLMKNHSYYIPWALGHWRRTINSGKWREVHVHYFEANAVLMGFPSSKSRTCFLEPSPFGIAISWGPQRWEHHRPYVFTGDPFRNPRRTRENL